MCVLKEERTGHGAAGGVCVMEQCVEEGQQRVSQCNRSPHGILGLLAKYKRLLGLGVRNMGRNIHILLILQ